MNKFKVTPTELSTERKEEIAKQIQDPSLSLAQRAALRFKLFLEEDGALTSPDSQIPIYCTVKGFPDIYQESEKERLSAGHYVHERGRVCNISADWEGVLNSGLLCRREKAPAETQQCIDAIIAYTDRLNIAGLSHAARYGARSFLEALQMMRVLHFGLWISNAYHNTVGRFDQYMLPFYRKDIERGELTREQALILIEDFFYSFNRDSDQFVTYVGNNGQSLMLGGCKPDGSDAYNELTELCLEASLHNRCIDPKINLRVNKNTPLSVYEFCTKLTKQGLGFPQYANDDVVIPALVNWGYDIEDARNYTVAACWEFIVPGVGMDIPNIAAVSHAEVIRNVILNDLKNTDTFDELIAHVRKAEFAVADELEASLKPLWIEPAPYYTALMSNWEHDISEGAKYNNYGVHGTGFTTAVDQLAVVKQCVFDDKSVSPERLCFGMKTNFENDKELCNYLRREAPKTGRDEMANEILDKLIDIFADAWEGRVNERGGIFRPGTGTAMYYSWHTKNLGATADGRLAGEPYSANFTPTLLVVDAGPLSVISAMARPNLIRACNGGPLTMELHDTVFKNTEGEKKVAQLVKSYIDLGGHQLQLNAVSPETLRAAQKNPEAYQGLIVRVWGWSGHFVQLDPCWQDQIIRRVSYSV